MHSARNAYATLTLCALTLGFAPRPRVSRCTQLRLSPDREELRKLRVKELQAELGKRNIRWQSFLEKEELVVALSEALEAAENFSGSGAMTPGLVAELTAEQVELELQHDGAPLLLDVYATWCGPCQLMAPELRKAAAELGATARVGKLDSDGRPEARRDAARGRAAHDRRVPRWAGIDARRGRRHGRRPRAHGA